MSLCTSDKETSYISGNSNIPLSMSNRILLRESYPSHKDLQVICERRNHKKSNSIKKKLE